MGKPRVTTRCVANSYTAPNERIIEFSSKSGGGLIAFRECEDNSLLVSVYRTDPGVVVGADSDVLTALEALLDWGREHTSPLDPNSPHDLLVAAAAAVAKARGRRS